jgi:site-specific DNA-methyltransferase (adenine-specific)
MEQTETLESYLAKRQPLRVHEVISVFYRKQPTYNPQPLTIAPKQGGGRKKNTPNFEIGNTGYYRQTMKGRKAYWSLAPIITVTTAFHPTQKPVVLFEYLIRSHTNPGDLVLDIARAQAPPRSHARTRVGGGSALSGMMGMPGR